MSKKRILKKVSFAAMLFVIAAGFMILYQIKTYNDSVLEIYASQQDQYIKLVLDQINLEKGNSDAEQKVIKEIIGSIDGNEKEYWTLSKKDSLVFVKDVTETDQYRGFSTASYYVSESGKSFLNSLEKDKVTHRFITQSDQKYIASGVLFEVNGDEYKICLLTNEKFVLNSNDFMQAEIIIMTGVIFLLIIFLAVSMTMARSIDKKQDEIEKLEEKIQQRNVSIEKIENEFQMISEYDVKNTLFREKTVERFMEKIGKRDVSSVGFETIIFKNRQTYNRFLQSTQWLLDKKTLRFEMDNIKGKKAVLLVFIGHSQSEMDSVTKMLTGTDDRCLISGKWKRSDDTALKDYCDKYLKEIRE